MLKVFEKQNILLQLLSLLLSVKFRITPTLGFKQTIQNGVKAAWQKLLYIAWLALMGVLVLLAVSLLYMGTVIALGFPFLIPFAGTWLMIAMGFLGVVFGYGNVTAAVSAVFLGAGILTLVPVAYFALINPLITKLTSSGASSFIVRTAINLGIGGLGLFTILLGLTIGIGAAPLIPGVGSAIAGGLVFLGSIGIPLPTFVTSTTLLTLGFVETGVSVYALFLKPRPSDPSGKDVKQTRTVVKQESVVKQEFETVVDLKKDLEKAPEEIPGNTGHSLSS